MGLHVRPHVLQDREFEGCAVMGEFILPTAFAMEAVEGDPFVYERVIDAVVMTDSFVAGRTS